MRITFVAEAYESLGIEYLSSALKRSGHTVNLVYDPKLFSDAFLRIGWIHDRLFSQERLVEKVLQSKPDLVGFSVMSETFLWNLQIAGLLRERTGTPIIFGGIHATSCPDQVLEEEPVDIVCVGEGEAALVELADRFDREGRLNCHGISNLLFKEGGLTFRNSVGHVTPDLDTLDYPDKRLFADAAPHMGSRYYVMTSRGCPYNCSFCYNSTVRDKRRYIRRRSVDNVIGELEWARKQGLDYSYVMFGDDTFVQDKGWLREFLDLYSRRIAKPFVCAIHPRQVDDETVALLKEAGCTDIEIGIQTVNPQIRRQVLKRPESNDEIFTAMRRIRRHGIRLIIDHIGGIPGESVDDYEHALLEYAKYRPNFVAFFWLAYYPETTIARFAHDHGILSGEQFTGLYRGLGVDGRGRYDQVAKEYMGFEPLFAILPIVPEALIRVLVARKAYRHIRWRSIGLMVIFPRLIRCILDLNFKPFLRHITRYGDLFHYLKRG